jgi:hypothetical protein
MNDNLQSIRNDEEKQTSSDVSRPVAPSTFTKCWTFYSRIECAAHVDVSRPPNKTQTCPLNSKQPNFRTSAITTRSVSKLSHHCRAQKENVYKYLTDEHPSFWCCVVCYLNRSVAVAAPASKRFRFEDTALGISSGFDI